MKLESSDAEKIIIVIDGCDSLLYCESRQLGASPVSITIVKAEVVTTRQAFDEKIRGTGVTFKVVILFPAPARPGCCI